MDKLKNNVFCRLRNLSFNVILRRYFKRLISICSQFFKYPSPDTNASTSSAGGEVLKQVLRSQLLFHSVLPVIVYVTKTAQIA